MSLSPNLNLPFVASGQAQKHVTVNESLVVIDSLMHLAVDAAPSDAPPEDAEEGGRWLVGEDPEGDWAGQAGKLAVFLDGGWRFHAPRRGWLVHAADTGTLLVFSDGQWSQLPPPSVISHVERLGVGTGADPSNPLSARLNNALFAALEAGDGGDGDLRVKLSKETSGDTAGLLFQTGFSGRAEIGLLAGDDLSLKVSPDGSAWVAGLVMDKDDGSVRLPANPKFRASLNHDAYIPAGAWTKAPFNVAAYDPLSDFDTADHDYTTPIDGFYVFGAQVGQVSDGTPPTVAYAAFYVNGAAAEETEMRSVAVNSNRGYGVLTLARYLTAGTVVDVRVYYDANDSNLDDASCQFWGFLVP